MIDAMPRQLDVRTADGRTLRAHDAGPLPDAALDLVWHHGSPHSGALYEPLLSLAARRRIRLVAYARPGYGGSTPMPGRSVADAAADVAAVMDELGIERFAVMGASGGGPHALACAALLPARVLATVAIASPAPYSADPWWFDEMRSPGALRAALDGREARARYGETEAFDPESFTPTDWAALQAEWAPLGADADAAGRAGPDGLIDDDVAFVSPWGVDPSGIDGRVLVVQGGEDRVIPRRHGDHLHRAIRHSELWHRSTDGHVSVLRAVPDALDWLLDHAQD